MRNATTREHQLRREARAQGLDLVKDDQREAGTPAYHLIDTEHGWPIGGALFLEEAAMMIRRPAIRRLRIA